MHQSGGYRDALLTIVRLLIASVATLLAALGTPALAQTSSFANTTTGAINDVTCGTAGVLTRTFVVGSSFTISDVNLGILLTHTYRSDLQITLTSPGGTTVAIMTNVGGSGDNLNDLFDDSAAASISTHNGTATDTATGAPPYSHSFRPSAALSAFNGQNSAGTWTLTICDSAAQDVGNFARADLYLTQAPTNFADLSLTKTVSNTAPAVGASISYTLTVTNAVGSPLTATGVTVNELMPAGVSFTGASGAGSYNSSSGIWTVPSLAPGASASITVTGTVTASAGAIVTNFAEILTSSAPDSDSTPANGSTTEDDDASASITVAGTRVAGTPPAFTCPVGSTIFDWDGVTWAAGTTSASYPVTSIGTINIAISLSGASFLNNATYGGQSPSRQNVVTGGLSPGQFSIFELIDATSQLGTATTVITLPTAVPGVRFSLFDIDYAAGQFADRVTVTGTFNGAPVTPILTNGISNYVIGNSAYGDGTSADTSANGNVMVTFTSPVDTITIVYGNHSLAPADPGQQAIAIHDITLCNPQANVTVTKSSSIVSDPVNGTTNPKFIPGATVRYCILTTNAGSATTTGIVVTDSLPANVTYVPGSMSSATTCAAAGTPEDDDASGADESDPFGMQISGTTIAGIATSIGPSASFAMRFEALVN